MHGLEFDFAEVIQPIDRDTFFSDYWEKLPLVVSRNAPDHYSGLFSVRDIDAVIWNTNPPWGVVQLANHSRKDDWVDYTAWPPAADNLVKAYNQGDTIVFNDLQTCWRPLAVFCRNLETFFNFLVNVNLYMTPKGAQGLSPHFDDQDVFILQVEGSKQWRLYEPILPLPLDEILHLVADAPHGQPSHEICLNAGDLLYIPRGFSHEATTAESSSMHLSVAVTVSRWKTLIATALHMVSEQDIEFRKSLPVGFLNSGEMTGTLETKMQDLLKRFMTSVNVQQAVEQQAGLLVKRMRPLPDAHFGRLNAADGISLDTVVEKKRGMLCYVITDADSVRIEFPGGNVAGPIQIEPALRFVAESGAFTVREMPDSVSDNTKLVLVRRLIQDNLLTVVN